MILEVDERDFSLLECLGLLNFFRDMVIVYGSSFDWDGFGLT